MEKEGDKHKEDQGEEKTVTKDDTKEKNGDDKKEEDAKKLCVEIDIVSLLPIEFSAETYAVKELEGDIFAAEEEWASLLDEKEEVDPAMMQFENPIEVMTKHLKPLYIKASINDRP